MTNTGKKNKKFKALIAGVRNFATLANSGLNVTVTDRTRQWEASIAENGDSTVLHGALIIIILAQCSSMARALMARITSTHTLSKTSFAKFAIILNVRLLASWVHCRCKHFKHFKI